MHHGSCHCGKVKFQFEATIDGAARCNCSICSRKGGLLFAVPDTQFKLLTSSAELSSYAFNKRAIVHRFCKTCGGKKTREARDDSRISYYKLLRGNPAPGAVLTQPVFIAITTNIQTTATKPTSKTVVNSRVTPR
jgi:hypothetical protein